MSAAGEVSADLSMFDGRAGAQEGVDMPLRNPLGQRTNVVLRVRGIDSQAYEDTSKAQIRRRNERLPASPTEAERTADFWQLQASLVAGWTPARIRFEKGGDELDCTPANVARVLEQHPWIFEQVMEFSRKRANFLPGSSSS